MESKQYLNPNTTPTPTDDVPPDSQAIPDTHSKQPTDPRPKCDPYYIDSVCGNGLVECKVPGIRIIDFYR